MTRALCSWCALRRVPNNKNLQVLRQQLVVVQERVVATLMFRHHAASSVSTACARVSVRVLVLVGRGGGGGVATHLVYEQVKVRPCVALYQLSSVVQFPGRFVGA